MNEFSLSSLKKFRVKISFEKNLSMNNFCINESIYYMTTLSVFFHEVIKMKKKQKPKETQINN